MIGLKDFLNIVATQFENNFRAAHVVEAKLIVQMGAQKITFIADESNININMDYDGMAPKEDGEFKIEAGVTVHGSGEHD